MMEELNEAKKTQIFSLLDIVIVFYLLLCWIRL